MVEPERVAVAGEPGMDELARVACGRYGLPDQVDLQLYPLTENWTYRVQAGPADPVVLRIYRPGGRSHAEILSELAWMGAIRADAESLVPAVISTARGSQVLELTREVPAGPCYCVLFSCVPGREPADVRDRRAVPEPFRLTGRRVLAAMDDLALEFGRTN